MLSLYVHIPFCRRRCPYCDFYLVAGDRLLPSFFDALILETRSRAASLAGREVGAIHFGGGTPSMAPARLLDGWIGEVSRLCRLRSDAELTLEANPEDLDRATLSAWRRIGVNRLSLGVQSFNPAKLRSLGRAHGPDEAIRATAMAMEVFPSLSLDLICGVPGETLSAWQEDLDRAIGTGVQHVSVYMLSVEPKTALHRDVRRGLVGVPSEELQAACYLEAADRLALAGYHHYEISNFSLPGHHSRYNLATWRREPYLGFGPSAHSFVREGGEEVRFSNLAGLRRYLDNPSGAEVFRERLGEEERRMEELYLQLRINGGIDLASYRKGNNFGHGRPDPVASFLERGWARVERGKLYLLPQGFLFADLVAVELLQHGGASC